MWEEPQTKSGKQPFCICVCPGQSERRQGKENSVNKLFGKVVSLLKGRMAFNEDRKNTVCKKILLPYLKDDGMAENTDAGGEGKRR